MPARTLARWRGEPFARGAPLTVYYNENDPKAAQWLRNLIAAGHIAKGDVDDRSILDVRPSDLIGYVQCHFFAGIGIWSDALRRAGWPDTRPVWTGSCPCQPFSAAGQGAGFDDERHLWPAWEWLQRHAKPRGVPILGEQVASKAGLAWLDLVQADLEGQGYTVRALDLCAAGVGAPHIRQRIYFVADTRVDGARQHARELHGDEGQHEVGAAEGCATEHAGRSAARAIAELMGYAEGSGPQQGSGSHGGTERAGHGSPDAGVVGHADDAGLQGRGVSGTAGQRLGAGQCAIRSASAASGMGNADVRDTGQHALLRAESQNTTEAGGGSTTSGFWRDAEWLPCLDGKSRPVEPGTFPLAHGIEGRVVRLRAYGNAIVAPLAEEFIRAYIAESDLSDLL